VRRDRMRVAESLGDSDRRRTGALAVDAVAALCGRCRRGTERDGVRHTGGRIRQRRTVRLVVPRYPRPVPLGWPGDVEPLACLRQADVRQPETRCEFGEGSRPEQLEELGAGESHLFHLRRILFQPAAPLEGVRPPGRTGTRNGVAPPPREVAAGRFRCRRRRGRSRSSGRCRCPPRCAPSSIHAPCCCESRSRARAR